jgi:hypothetical protein
MVPAPQKGFRLMPRSPYGHVPVAIAALALFVAGASPAAATEDRYVLIVCGNPGEPRYEQRFADWSARLERLFVGSLELPEDRLIRVCADIAKEAPPPDLEALRMAIDGLHSRLGPDDDLLIFLIGHGSIIRGEPRFLLRGTDLTPEKLQSMFEPLRPRSLVLVNAAASSAGFINTLSGPDRLIVTATKSVDEINATEFMEHFLRGLETGSADLNRDGRISLLEAARQAATLTSAWYESEGFLPSEHALIDDNGDALGTRLLAGPQEAPVAVDYPTGEGVRLDGAAAARYFLKDYSFPPEVPESLSSGYLELLKRIEELKARKAELPAARYRRELEGLLIEAAKTHREIRRIIDASEP